MTETIMSIFCACYMKTLARVVAVLSLATFNFAEKALEFVLSLFLSTISFYVMNILRLATITHHQN